MIIVPLIVSVFVKVSVTFNEEGSVIPAVPLTLNLAILPVKVLLGIFKGLEFKNTILPVDTSILPDMRVNVPVSVSVFAPTAKVPAFSVIVDETFNEELRVIFCLL